MKTLINTIKVLATASLLLGSQAAWSQAVPSKTQNHVLTKSARTATTSQQAFDALFDKDDMSETILYVDGLGRPIQTVDWEASPQGKDVIATTDYNDLGQVSEQFMPFTSNQNLGQFQDAMQIASNRSSFYSTSNLQLNHWPTADLAAPLSESLFEASPLGRVVEQSAPGAAWQVERNALGESTGQGNTVRQSWRPNVASDSVIFFPNGAGAGFQVQKFWAAGELWVSNTLDENGNLKQQFKDKQGRLILDKCQIDPSTFAYTYHIYAANSHDLTFVLQPQGARELVTSPHNGLLSQSLLDQQAFQYRYDFRHRIVEKRVPGSDWNWIIYNNIDQPIMTQDGKQRTSNEWFFTKYDALARPVITGIWTDTQARSRAVIQQMIQQETSLWESSSNQHISSQHGYTNIAFPDISQNCDLLSVSYFDSYDFNRNSIADANESFTNDPLVGGSNQLSMSVKGKVTGVKQRILGSNNWLLTVTFYDVLGRELQTMAENSLNGFDRVTFAYNFTGTIAQSSHFHMTSAQTIQIYKVFDYDHRDRLLTIKMDMEKGAGAWTPQPIMLSKSEYNELGELTFKGLHSQNQGLSFLQEVDYEYNIRGWLSKINEIETCGKRPSSGGSGGLIPTKHIDAINVDKFTANISSTTTGELKMELGDQKTADVSLLQQGKTVTQSANSTKEVFMPASTPNTAVQLDIPMNHLKVMEGDFSTVDSEVRRQTALQLRGSGFSSSDQTMLVEKMAGSILDELGDIFEPNKDLFALELLYDQPSNLNSAATAQYNGNIAAMKWQTPSACENKLYAFEYDKLNRLVNAWFAMENSSGFLNQDRYSSSYNYDRNGNLTSLQREGLIASTTSGIPSAPGNITQFGRLDDLTYSYAGNQLLAVADVGPDNVPAGVTHFIDNAVDLPVEYQYDANGNMINDANKGLQAVYNFVNKPTEVDMGNGQKIRYIYLADGTKLRKEAVNNGTTVITHYVSGFEYEDAGSGADLLHFSHEEGRVVFNNAGPKHFDMQYRLQDHLGNTRILFRQDPANAGETEVLQEQAYYPFGMTLAEGNLPTSSPADNYTYNGKEIQSDFGLNWIDYGARMYDASLGRFNSIDRYSENYLSLSPFNYVGGNPIINIDINGDSIYNVYSDGSIVVTASDEYGDTNHQFRYFDEGASGDNYVVLGTLAENENGLVEFPESGTGFDRYGTEDAGGASYFGSQLLENVGEGDHYLDPKVAAALYGLTYALSTEEGFTLSLGDMSSSNGSDPWQPGFTHHAGHGHNGTRSGKDVDFRYLNANGVSFQDANATSSSSFDQDNNQTVYDRASDFGFNKNYRGNNAPSMNNSSTANGHNDHGHLGFGN